MFVTDHKHCTGCGACIEACPQSAVIKIRDKYKFVYPSVQEDMCKFCGKCLEVCPKDKPIDRFEREEFEQRYYIAQTADKNELLNAHAGGIFHRLAMKVLSNGGVVYGCIFDENRHPRHVRADNAETLGLMRGFKPVQSDTDGIYSAVKTDLEGGINVLFSGTPCQCDGLRGYLGRDYLGLTIVDVLCGGMTSEGVFNRYYYWLERKLGDKIMELRFENKQAFGHSRGIRVLYRRKKQRFLLSFPLELDKLNAMSIGGAINRRSCGTCKYASTQRVGDISLGRFVAPARSHPDFNYAKGASLVVVSTPKGTEIFESNRDMSCCEQSDLERTLANKRLSEPTKQNPQRKKILSDICRGDFNKAAKEFKSAGVLQAVKIFFCAAIPDEAVYFLIQTAKKIKKFALSLTEKVKKSLKKSEDKI